MLTVDFNDFKKLVKKDKPGIFGIESHLSNEQDDNLVCNYLSRKNPDDYIGKATRIPSVK